MTSPSTVHEAGHPKLVLSNDPEGQGGEEGARGFRMWGTRVYLWLIHVWQKTTQCCKVIILQLK